MDKRKMTINMQMEDLRKIWKNKLAVMQQSLEEDESISSDDETGSYFGSQKLIKTRSDQNFWEPTDIWKDLQQLPNAEKIVNHVETENNTEGFVLNLDDSKTTGLLITAWLGKDNILKALVDQNANLQVTDKCGRTALHLAAYAGRVNCVKILLHHGAKVNAWDKQNKATALHCAACSGNVECLKQLILTGADINAGLAKRSPLHYAVQNDAIDCVAELLRAGAFPNTPQVFTETPLHVAAALGSADCVKLLLENGAEVRMQYGIKKTTALHLAAEDGNPECARLLLDAGANITDQNYKKQTPLHMAALAQSTETLQLLLKRGASPNAEDIDGRTPLHGAIDKKASRCCEIVKLLLEAKANVNKADRFGYTPLHIAALNELSNCVLLLLNHGGDVTAKTNGGVLALSFILRRTPDALAQFLAKFDKSIKVSDREIGDIDCEIKLDFKILVPSVGRSETELIQAFIEVGKKDVLKHPLCEIFLHLKWKKIRKFFLFSLFYHAVFALLFTAYVLCVFLWDWKKPVKSIGYPLFILTFLLVAKEMFQVLHGIRVYISHWENWLQWLIIVCIPLCAIGGNDEKIQYWQNHIAAIGIFLTWLELMLIVGRFPIFGLYVQMFQIVAKNFSKFFLAYSCLLIAFGLSFGILFKNYRSFNNILLGMLKTIIMMAGELEFEDMFFPEDTEQIGNKTEQTLGIKFPVTSHLLFLTFVLLVTIILTNLMVGLAVSDIQGLQQSAGLDRLVRRAELIAHLESMLFSQHFYLPKKILTVFQRNALLLCSQYHWAFYIRPNDPRENRLPKDLLKNVYRLVAERKKKFKNRKEDESTGDMCSNYSLAKSEYSLANFDTKLAQILGDLQQTQRVLEQKTAQLKEIVTSS